MIKLLFDTVFNNPKWQGKDNFLSCGNEWKMEINNWLLYIQEKHQLERYIPRLNDCTNAMRDEALAEIFSAYILEIKFKYSVIQWEEKTINERDVDFVIQNGLGEIYCEVKSPGWEGELEQNERLSGRKDRPKHMNGEFRDIAPYQAIRHALKKSYPKFLTNCKNLLIIKDDLFISPLDFPSHMNMNINKALFADTSEEKGYFVNNAFENIGGVLFLHCVCMGGTMEYRYKFVDNKNSRNPFSISLDRFNQ